MATTLTGTQLIGGQTSTPQELLFSSVGISFWGGVDPLTSKVCDHTHPLFGEVLQDRVLAIPNGRGSCTGSQVMLELLLNGIAPAALVLRQPDAILALGVVVAQEMFNVSIPVVCLGPALFDSVAGVDGVRSTHAAVVGSAVFCGSSRASVQETVNAYQADVSVAADSHPKSADKLLSEAPLVLTADEQAMLSGDHGEAVAVAMRIVARSAAIDGAPSLLPVTQCHIDGCTYIGPGGLRFAETLADMGGRVSVPTTLNSNSVDRRQWRTLGVPSSLGEPAQALGDAYLAMGCSDRSFTCAPYLLESAPKYGEQIAWGESNAVVFANSVLGARTQKYADYLDICAAIAGRVPLSGPHLDKARAAEVVLDASELVEAVFGTPHCANGNDNSNSHVDAFFPALGYLCGLRSESQVPVVVGLENGVHITKDHLKAFSAAFGSTAAVAMFHMVGHTPEAPTASAALNLGREDGDIVLKDSQTTTYIKLTMDDLDEAWRALDWGCKRGAGIDSGTDGSRDSGDADPHAVELVAVGNPHLSLEECASLGRLCAQQLAKGDRVKPGVSMVATLGREVFSQALAAGHVAPMEQFGVQFITDTCWCMLTEPVVPPEAEALVTNSAKFAHYAPGLIGRRTHFNSLSNCVTAARTGFVPPPPPWIRLGRRAMHTFLRRLVRL